jgi:hypothetical protein
MDIDIMTDLAKAIKFMDFMDMDYGIVDGKMFICAWNKSLSETFEFQVAQEEIECMAQGWDLLRKQEAL